MRPVAVIGGGITGLTAAFYLERKGVPVTVYEAGERVGGVIQSLRSEGFLAEFGPNTILETAPQVGQLVTDAGLQARRLDSDPRAAARYVVRYRRPIAMPSSPLGFFTTPLFSAWAKLAVLREPFVSPRRDGVEESIAQFVRRRLGQEFLEHAIDALVAGIYAGDPEKLSVTQAFPKLAQLEARYGSLIKGQIFGGRDRKKRGEVAKDRAPKFSFDEGLQVLPETLAQKLGDAVCLRTTIAGLAQRPDGWTVDLANGESREHSAVLYAGTAFGLAKLKLQAQNTFDLPSLAQVRYPPVASIVLGFLRQDVEHPCEGFGMLIPKVEGFKLLGTIFSSSLFPNRAPGGHVTLTSYIGGERYPELAGLTPSKLVSLTLEDLRVLVGVQGTPVFEHTAFYAKAIPQYNVGYERYRELMTRVEQGCLGFFIAGHFRDGVSLSDSILSGSKAAERVASFVSSLPHCEHPLAA